MRHKGYIRQRSKGSFDLRYNLGTDPLTGKRKRVETTFKGTYADAQKELRKLLRNIDSGEHIEPSKITVEKFLQEWLHTIHSQISPQTYERYEQVVRNFLIPSFGKCLLAKLMPLAIQQAYNKLETSGRCDRKSGGLSPQSRLHIHRIFKSALKYALQVQLIARNPADAVKAPRVKRATLNIINVEQSAFLLDAIRGKNVYWPVLLALTTGMRRGEVLALRWKNVDFPNKTVRVIESLEQTKNGLRFKAPKTERTRAVILPECVVEELCYWKEKQAAELAELAVEATQETLVCSRYDGGPLWPSSLTHEFTKAIKNLPELPRIRFHDLRHSHATQLLMAGIHPKIAQERLGHSTITTTLDLYSHVTDTMQDDAASKLDRAFRNARKPHLLSPSRSG